MNNAANIMLQPDSEGQKNDNVVFLRIHHSIAHVMRQKYIELVVDVNALCKKAASQ